MPACFDVIIVGAGLAGASAAWSLSRHARVLVLEAGDPASGASGAAAGLVNPLMGRKARPAWRADEALAALHALLDAASATDLFRPSGLLRPAAEATQARVFREVARAHPDYADWLPAGAARARFPGMALDEGTLFVRRGGALSVVKLVRRLLAAAQRQDAEVRTGRRVAAWGEDAEGAFVRVQGEEKALRARRVVLAIGYGYHLHPNLARLNLHGVKGQTVWVARPEGLSAERLLPLSGQGYIVPEGDTLIVGSSYERDFSDLKPSDAQSRKILAKAARMLPDLRDATVLNASAGVRVTVPGTRLPMLGPLPGHRNVWIFTGLGSKGLLMAPLLARDLPAFFDAPETIPAEIRVATR